MDPNVKRGTQQDDFSDLFVQKEKRKKGVIIGRQQVVKKHEALWIN